MKLRFTLRQLEYFVAVGKNGSIAKAAEKVNVSSPSISAAITQLEEEFGILLFARKHAHGLILTQAGKQFMEQALKVLQEAGSMNKLATNLSGNVQGQLNIGCLLTFAQMLVPGLRRTFEERFPEVNVKQYELDQLAIFDQLRQAGIDLAITYDLDIPQDIKFVPLVELPPYAMMHSAHPLAQRSSVSIEELNQYPMVMLNLPHSTEYFMSLYQAHKVEPKIVETTRDMAVVRSMVANGFGYSLGNLRPFNDLSPDGQPIRFTPISGDVRSLNLGIAMVEGADRVLTVSTFAKHCFEFITNSKVIKNGNPRGPNSASHQSRKY